jgi:hypothetical protein
MNIVVATDGSESAIDAARRSMELLRPGAHVVLVMVIPAFEDPMEDAGGIEGPVISEKQAEKDWKKETAAGQAALDRTAAALGTEAEVRLVPRRRIDGVSRCPNRRRDEGRRAGGRIVQQGLVEPTLR